MNNTKDKKRAFDGVGGDVGGSSSKKLKSDNHVAVPVGGTGRVNGAPSGMSPQDLIAQKRAEIAAKHAEMMKKNPALASIGTKSSVRPSVPLAAPQPKVPILPASLPSKVVYAGTPSPSLGTFGGASVSSGPTPATSSGGVTPVKGATPGISDDLERKVAEAKRRVADAQSKLAIKDNPYMSLAQSKRPASTSSKPSTPLSLDGQPQQGAGLKMPAHPLLLDATPVLAQSKKDRYKPMQPKFASIKANVRNQPTPQPIPVVARPSVTPVNPYSTPVAGGSGNASAGGTPAPGGAAEGIVFDGAPRERQGKKFHFNPKGKYVALGNQMRQEIQLEDLKQRIAAGARKAGLDEEVLNLEKGLKRAPPPDCEWWDVDFLPSRSYSDIDTLGIQNLPIRTRNSEVTIYVEHPIPIPAASDKVGGKVELKPMMLTQKEQKKMRKLRRKGELQDKRDRIRMGLLPPDPPKVRLANLMKVLTSDAIQDPTRVEARVRREVAMRRHTHEKMNAERKLTDEQKKEKWETKKMDEERKGVFGAVFKVMNLSDPSHSFKVRKNADQRNLTGLCILNPNFNLVYVEGAARFLRSYKKLMLNRIKWTVAAPPRGAEDVELEDSGSESEGEGQKDGQGHSEKKASAAQTLGEASTAQDEKAKSLENNKCLLIWEGALKDRAFNAFKPRTCPTDREAKEVLGELRGYWDIAKGWKDEDEEGF